MPNIQEIIRQIERDFLCPICGQHYDIGKIKVHGAFDQSLIVQTDCRAGHRTIFVTILKKTKPETITANYCLDLKTYLENFNGDFEKLWMK